jgi:hypothetical protein
VADNKTPDIPDNIRSRPLADELPAANKPGEKSVKDHIGRHLKLIFDEVANQPIPDRFIELLDKLDERRRRE